MEKQYFTPSIEDIKVGFEYEMLIDEKWRTMKLRHPEETASFLTNVYNLTNQSNPKVRVPYLTKEQIEAEGWKFIDNLSKNGSYFKKGDIDLEFRPAGYYVSEPYNITIAYDLDYPQYNGHCKDINTFRYICKLLNIK